jgi:hypothetical protein
MAELIQQGIGRMNGEAGSEQLAPLLVANPLAVRDLDAVDSGGAALSLGADSGTMTLLP